MTLFALISERLAAKPSDKQHDAINAAENGAEKSGLIFRRPAGSVIGSLDEKRQAKCAVSVRLNFKPWFICPEPRGGSSELLKTR